MLRIANANVSVQCQFTVLQDNIFTLCSMCVCGGDEGMPWVVAFDLVPGSWWCLAP